MKRLLLIAASFAFLSFGANAQMNQKLPINPKIKTGTLENGLTYYVAQNAEPKGQAEFYIAQKVGSILEEENQRGLAHFLEHMAFNGTKHFPGNSIITYCESIGVKFGANLNAGTGIDQTVYNISSVPIKREGIIDSCLLILHDWACAINLEENDIDKERGVIREELRTRSNAMMRMYETALPDIFPGSPYGHRLPGGLVEVINKFTYDELRAYYHKWYRPDLQGIVVVGDFDVNVMEAKIKKLFGSIPKAVNPAPRTEFPIADTKEPLISVNSDPEATTTMLSLMFKNDVLPMEYRPTVASILNDYMNELVVSMINSRLSETAQKADAPFTFASADYGDYFVAQTKAALSINAGAKEGEIEKALKAIVNESERVRKFGFTASEYERAKANYMSSLEQSFKEKDKQKNSYYVNQALNHFLRGNAIPGIEMEYNLMQQVAPAIPLENINQYAQQLPKLENNAIVVLMPKKEGLKVPTKEEVGEMYKKALADNVEAYKETVSNEPLIKNQPVAGKVVAEKEEPVTGSTVWTLSNGATVVIKKTDFKQDQILFAASSRGGSSLIDKSNIENIKVISDVMNLGGLGAFSATDLRKVLAGKNVGLKASISTQMESATGNSAPKDIETFLQLVYLQFTSMRTDEDAFKSFMARTKASLVNSEAEPMTAFSDTIQAVLYKNNVYAKRLTMQMLDKVNYAKIMELAKARFANAADFTFSFVGNVDPATLKPLVEKYIASLPADKTKKENWKDVGLYPAKGKIVKHFDKEMKTPKATIYNFYTGKLPYTVENTILADMMKQVFDIVFNKTIREEEQGTYGVGVSMSVSYYPEESFMFLFGFDTDVALKDKLLKRAYLEINNVIEKGIDPKDFAKITEYMQKNYTQNLRENSYWRNAINNKFVLNKDMHTTYEATLKSITPEKLQSFIKSAMSQGNQLEAVMSGFAKVATK